VEELQQCQGERDEALLLQSALQRSVEELQSASQTSTHTGVDIAHAQKRSIHMMQTVYLL
jgi:hypothetical protein